MGTASEVSVWTSDTALVCQWARGVGGSGRLVVTLGERRHSSSDVASYDVPLLGAPGNGSSDRLACNVPATGGLSITLQGHTLGVASYTSRLRLGSSAQEGTMWTSDTTLAARASSSVARSLTARLTAGIQARASASASFSIDAPLASSMSTTNSAGIGQLVLDTSASSDTFGQYTQRFVLAHGAGFATYAVSLILRAGATLAEASHWHSDSQLLTKKPHGVGGSVAVILSVGVSARSQLAMMSYDVVRTRIHRGGSAGFGIHGWEPDIADNASEAYHYKYSAGEVTRVAGNAMLVMNSPSTGALNVIIKTAQLSKHDYSPTMRAGISAAEVTRWVSDSICVFMTPAGVTWALPTPATLALQVSTLSIVFTYDDARALSTSSRVNLASTGSVRLSVQGAGFGSAARSTHVRLGHTANEATLWNSDSTMTVRISGAGSFRASRRVVMTSGMLRRGSLTQTASLDVPSLLAYNPSSPLHNATHAGAPWRRNVPSARSVVQHTLHGSFFGLSDASPVGSLAATASQASRWVSDTSMLCRMASAAASTRRLSVSASNVAFSHTAIFSLDLDAGVSMLRASNRAATGASSVSLLGTSFALACYTAGIRSAGGASAAEATEWASDSAVRGLLSAGTPATRRVSVTVGDKAASLTVSWSYSRSALSSAGGSNRPATGSVSLTVQGTSLSSVSQGSGQARIGGRGSTAAEATSWVSTTSLIAAGSAAASARSHRVLLTASKLVGTASSVLR